MKLIEISLEEVLRDSFFCFTSVSDIGFLKRSVLESGIRTPLHVLPARKGYRLLSGFKRFGAAVELGLERIPAAVHSEKAPLERLFREVLLEHLTCETLSIVEKARVLRILDRLCVPWESMKTDFLPILDLPKRSEIIEEVKDVLRFSSTVQDYIERYGLSLKQTKMFTGLSVHQEELFVSLGMNLQIRSVELSEIISIFRDIFGKEKIPVEQVYDDLGIDALLENTELSRNEKILRIKKELQKRRYPRLGSWNENLERLKREMKLPERVRLSWDRSLEVQGFVLRAEIRSAGDVEKIAVCLSSEENRRRFEEMLRVV